MLTPEQKRKAKRKLFELSDDKERSEIIVREMEEVQDQFSLLHKAISDGSTKPEINQLLVSMTQGLEKMRGAYIKGMVEFSKSFKDYHEGILKHIGDMHATIKTQAPKDVSGFFKDFPTLLAQGNEHSKKTSELISNLKWNASMQIRDREGSPVTPYSLSPNITSGRKQNTTAGTAVQINAASIPCFKVTLSVPLSNAGTAIYVGDSTAKATASSEQGVQIVVGATHDFFVIDVNLLWFDVTTSNDWVSYNVYKKV